MGIDTIQVNTSVSSDKTMVIVIRSPTTSITGRPYTIDQPKSPLVRMSRIQIRYCW